MLPDPNDPPACLSQSTIRILIASSVRLDLVFPPLAIRFWESAMEGTSVPVTAIYEDGHLLAAEDDVCLPSVTQRRDV